MGQTDDVDRITSGLGENFELMQTGFKSFSCCASIFTSLEGLSKIMKDYSLQAGDIKRITIRSTTVTKLHVGWDYRPKGITTAQMNLLYCLAVMALEGETFVDQFTEEKIGDPKTLEFIKRIEVIPDPELDRLGQGYRHAVICHVETKDGRLLERRVDFANGGPSNPVTREEARDKFMKLTAKILPEKKTQHLYQTIRNMEHISSLTELTRYLVS